MEKGNRRELEALDKSKNFDSIDQGGGANPPDRSDSTAAPPSD